MSFKIVKKLLKNSHFLFKQFFYLRQIAALGQEVQELEADKNRAVYELDIVGQQQTELAALVGEMEKALGLPADFSSASANSTWGSAPELGGGASSTPTDGQRQNMYLLIIVIDFLNL
jgi:hypothetical protein